MIYIKVEINHMMRISQDFLNHLFPVELSFIRTEIDKLYKEKVTL